MVDSVFSLDETLATSWEVFKKNFWRYLGLLGLTGLVITIPAMLLAVAKIVIAKGLQQVLVMLVLTIAVAWIAMITKIGIDLACLMFLNGEKPDSNTLWKPTPITFPYLGATILFYLAIAIGCIVLIVPGFYIYIRLQFYLYFMLEYKCGPIESLKASWYCTENSLWELVLFCLVQLFIEGVGASLVITAIPASMFTKLAEAKAYRVLHDAAVPDLMPFALNKDRTIVGEKL
ncbi:MAG: hypothetical protein IPG59_20060 [Candidatus Melainabacteria bacterium]|nr:MAG: hypothetical protein IPG59_20060 [Candidatus Melainabacteria bacterium]